MLESRVARAVCLRPEGHIRTVGHPRAGFTPNYCRGASKGGSQASKGGSHGRHMAAADISSNDGSAPADLSADLSISEPSGGIGTDLASPATRSSGATRRYLVNSA
jgi:hypothetical protein